MQEQDNGTRDVLGAGTGGHTTPQPPFSPVMDDPADEADVTPDQLEALCWLYPGAPEAWVALWAKRLRRGGVRYDALVRWPLAKMKKGDFVQADMELDGQTRHNVVAEVICSPGTDDQDGVTRAVVKPLCLADGTLVERRTPTMVEAAAGEKVVNVAAITPRW